METVIIILSAVIVIVVMAVVIVLYNFMLLLSELNKRQVYIISDILSNIDLSTPHLDTLSANNENNFEDVIENLKEEEPFNPHDFDIDNMKNPEEEL